MVEHEQQNKPSEHSQVERFSTQPQIQQNTDDAKPRIEVLDEILKHLEKEKCNPMILQGEKGVGKTWIAREVSKQAISKKIVDVTLWIYPAYVNKDYVTEAIENVAYQLSIKQDMSGADNYFENVNDMNYLSRIESLKQTLKGKKYLVVFDNITCSTAKTMCGDDFWMKKLSDSQNDSPKVLVTACYDDNAVYFETPSVLFDDVSVLEREYGDECWIIPPKIFMKTRHVDVTKYFKPSSVPLKIERLTLLESKKLLQRNWDQEHIPFLIDDDLEMIVDRCKYFPGAIVFTGNVLLYALKNAPDDLHRNLAIAEAKKELDKYWMLGFEKFRDNVTHRRCLWRSWMALNNSFKRMNYNDLILYWILDGLFKNATSLEQAYTYGHSVLIDLIDAGLLGVREAGDVVLEFSGIDFGRYLSEVLCDDTDSILPIMFNGHNNVKRMNGCIAGFQGESGEPKLKTLVVKGNDNCKVDHIDSFRKSFGFKELNNLCVSDVQKLNLSLFDECHRLRVLILRDCHSVTHIDSIAAHRDLIVLEISGCSSFEVPEGFFVHLQKLVMLNLSGSEMKSFSSCQLSETVRYLILQKCIHLETFSEITGNTDLEKLDLSGAKFNSLESKPLRLEYFGWLEELHLSETNIYEVPDLRELGGLKYLFLKNCPLLKKIGSLNTLTCLRVIDASGCSKLDYFEEENLPTVPSVENLVKLDLSSTMIPKIPPLKNRLKHLCLKGCRQLKELPPIENANDLRILDVTDAIVLEKINCSFEEMESLEELLLSNTKITTLPPLSGLKSLRKLILRGCQSLQSLPDRFELTNLFLVDIRGCIALQAVPPLHEQLTNVVVLSDEPLNL